MLEQSPSTVADDRARAARARRAARAGRRVPPRRARSGSASAAWLAIVLARCIVLVGAIVPPAVRALEPADNPAPARSSQGILQGRGPPARRRPQRPRHAAAARPRARATRCSSSIGAVGVRLPRRRHARPDRRLLPAAASTPCSPRSSTSCSRSRSSSSRCRSSRCSPTTAIDKTGNQHPPSSGRRLLVLILALGIVSIPVLGPHHARQHAAVVAARVRARGARAGREQPPHHVPRGAAQRAARDVLDRAARHRGRDRRRRRPGDPRRRRAAARACRGAT